MKSSYESAGENKVLLTVEVPVEDMEVELDSAYDKIAKDIDVPGFRKGKVPRDIIDTRVGAETVMQEAVRDALPNFYIKAIAETEIVPVDVPDVDIKQSKRGEPLIFTAMITVKPEPILGQYEGITVEKLMVEVKDEEIEQNIDTIRERFAVLEDMDDDRAIENGDFAIIDFKGFVEGKPFDGGELSDYTLQIGSGTFIDTFEDQLIGTKKGEGVEVNVVFPENYGAENLAGKPAKFEVKIKNIKVKKLPDLTDDLAKESGVAETAEELRKNITDELNKIYELQSENDMKARMLKIVNDNATVTIPEAMIEDEIDRQVDDFSRMLAGQGVELEKYYEVTGKKEADLRSDFRAESEKTVKVKLVLEAIAKAQKIEVEESEIDTELESLANRMQQPMEELRERVLRAGTMNFLIEDIRRSKTIEWLASHANIEAVEKITPLEGASETDQDEVEKAADEYEAAEENNAEREMNESE